MILNKLLHVLNEELTYLYALLQSVLRHFYVKKGYVHHPSEIKHFRKGDFVETKTGIQGRVWRLFRDIKTGQVKGCIVIWEDLYNGQKFSMLPSEDKGIEFNPIIRKAQ